MNCEISYCTFLFDISHCRFISSLDPLIGFIKEIKWTGIGFFFGFPLLSLDPDTPSPLGADEGRGGNINEAADLSSRVTIELMLLN